MISETTGQRKAMLRTARLELQPATLEIVAADLYQRGRLPALLGASLGAGWPPPLFDVCALQRLKRSLDNELAREGWTAWYWIVRSPRVLVGLSGFKGRLVNGAVEIFYSLLPQFQRRGLATEAIATMVAWAFANGAESVLAETLPELIASQRVLVKNGFSLGGEGAEAAVLRFERQSKNRGNISQSAAR